MALPSTVGVNFSSKSVINMILNIDFSAFYDISLMNTPVMQSSLSFFYEKISCFPLPYDIRRPYEETWPKVGVCW